MESRLNVKQCSLCPGYTEYYCHFCQKDLCQLCKAVHVIDLDTKHHKVTIYREGFNHLSKPEKCVTHRDQVYIKYCDPCEVPVCDSCSDHKTQGSFLLACLMRRGHSQHKLVDLIKAYRTKRQQHNEKLDDLRSETLCKVAVIVKEIISDANKNLQILQREISQCQYKMIERGKNLKHFLDNIALNELNTCNCLLQEIRMIKYINRIQNYEHHYQQPAYGPVQFLRFIKKPVFLRYVI